MKGSLYSFFEWGGDFLYGGGTFLLVGGSELVILKSGENWGGDSF